MAKLGAKVQITNFAGVEEKINQLLLHGCHLQTLPKEIIALLEKYNLISANDTTTDHLWKAQLVVQLLKKGAQKTRSFSIDEPAITADGMDSYCAYEAGKIIGDALQKKDWTFTKEAFRLLKATGQLLHPGALPSALNNLSKAYELWLSWEGVCGHGAAWLSPQRADWSWWQDLNLDQGAPVELIIWRSLHQKPLDEATFQNLRANDVRTYFKFLSIQPLMGNTALLNFLHAHSRSVNLRQYALDHLLYITTSEQRQEVDQFALSFCQSNLISKSDRLKLKKEIKMPQATSFDIESVQLYAARFANPVYRVLSVPTFATLFGHLEMSIDDICQQLMIEESLERFAQAAVYSCSKAPLAEVHSCLVSHWLEVYPYGNTVTLEISPLINRLDSKMVESMLSRILAEDQEDYTIERLSLILRDIKCYLSSSVSNKICKLFVDYINRGSSHTDKKNLMLCMPNLARCLDPKALLVLKKMWPQDALYYSDLSKPFHRLRDTLELRYELFLYISGSK